MKPSISTSRIALVLLWQFLSILAIEKTAMAQGWVNLGPGGGGWYRCAAFSPHEDKLIIGGDVSGVFVSTDYENFAIQNRDLINRVIQAIYFHPTDKWDIRMKYDPGRDTTIWSGWSEHTTAFAISPRNPAFMCYVTDMEIYLTRDGGKTWALISSKRVPDKPDFYTSSGADILCATSVGVNPDHPEECGIATTRERPGISSIARGWRALQSQG